MLVATRKHGERLRFINPDGTWIDLTLKLDDGRIKVVCDLPPAVQVLFLPRRSETGNIISAEIAPAGTLI